MAGEFRARGKESNARHIIGECNCRLLDALAGEFRGRGKESNVRHIIGECNCRLLDALAGELRGRGKESNVRHIIGECNCRLLDALAGELRGRGKETTVTISTVNLSCYHCHRFYTGLAFNTVISHLPSLLHFFARIGRHALMLMTLQTT